MQHMRHAARQILEVMHGDDHGHTAPHQPREQALRRGALPRIEAGERLIEQQHARAARERARDEGAPQLPIGQFARTAPRCRRQTEEPEPASCGAAILGGGRLAQPDARVPSARHQVQQAHIHGVIGLQLGRHVADVAFPRLDRRPGGKSAALEATAVRGRQIAVQQLEEAGFAGAIVAEHRPMLAFAHLPVHAGEHAPIADVQIRTDDAQQHCTAAPRRHGRTGHAHGTA